MKGPARAVERYLFHLRTRATVLYGVRAFVAFTGVGFACFALAAFVVGPVTSTATATLAWVTTVAGAVAALAWSLRGASRVRGAAVTHLVGALRGELASALRSAIELARDDRAHALSPALVEAHAARVSDALATVPARRVVPLAWLRHPAVLVGLGLALLGAVTLARVDRVNAGAFALLHPGETDAGGVRVAAVVGSVDARLVFPGYLARPPVTLHDAIALEAPRGTTIEITVTPRIETSAGVLDTAGTHVALDRRDDGSLVGRFVVREDGALRLTLRDRDGIDLRDPVPRSVRVLEDLAPRVALVEPEADLVVELDEDVPFVWEAADDIGLRSVDLVVKSPDGREVRRRLTQIEDTAPIDARGAELVVASAFGARPGDRIEAWIEARDGDEVSGPNIGRSPTRVLEVASEASRRAEGLGELSQVLARGLDALADRLENEVPARGDEVDRRYARARGSVDVLVAALDSLSTELHRQPAARTEASLFSEMARRLRRLEAREASVQGGGSSPRQHRRRVATDRAVIEELEADVMLIADTLGRARIEDAAAIARELESLRREMTSLLAELRRASSPEARAELLSAIARAEARMRELAERLRAMAEDVPSDFVNSSALEGGEASDALADLRDAVERGDLDAAERSLASLEQQIDALAQMLGSGMESFSEARFGPREQAMAEAMDSLSGLEAEQRQLARQSSDVRRSAAERAIAASGGENQEAAERLAGQAREVRTALEAVRRGGRGVADEEVMDRARQRLRDVEDALSTGDLGEARRMAEEAGADVDDVSRDLDLSALMFPGAEGGTSESAREARAAADQLRELRRDIDRAIPDVSDFVDDRGRRQMREDMSRQGETSRAAERLAGQLEEGPDGAPLSPDTARGVREARDAMERAGEALGHADPIEASRAQEEAARRLTELREELERQREQQQGGEGGGGSREGRDDARDFREAVRIPTADEFEGPMEQRRRLLDAMRESAPAGYGDAVRRYYEELLR